MRIYQSATKSAGVALAAAYDPLVAYGEHGEFFFHYTTADTAFRHILPSGELQLSPYSRMRDPLEAKAWHMGATVMGSDDEDSESRRFWELQEWIYRARELSKLLSLTIDGPPALGDELGGDGFGEFTRGYARASMWELYADRHAGVCLLFDRRRLTAVLEEQLPRLGTSFHNPVNYTIAGIRSMPGAWIFHMPGPEEPLEPAIVRHVETHREALFFTKLEDWEHEAEYRFVVVTEDDRPVRASYADALRAVMVGHAFPDWQIASARSACDEVGATPLKLNWDMGAPLAHKMPLPPLPTAQTHVDARARLAEALRAPMAPGTSLASAGMSKYELKIKPDEGEPGATPYESEDELREAFRLALKGHRSFTTGGQGGSFPQPGKFTAEMIVDGEVVDSGRPS